MLVLGTANRKKGIELADLIRPVGVEVRTLKTVLTSLLKRVEDLHEFNPMLGLRGCRLGILYPEITEMQARAIFEAVVAVTRKGKDVMSVIASVPNATK